MDITYIDEVLIRTVLRTAIALDDKNMMLWGQRHSDGVVQADSVVNETLLDYAKTKDIPLLGYQQDFADAYETFYEQLFPEEAE